MVQDPTTGPAQARAEASGGATPATPLQPWARALLRCPVTGAELVDAVGPGGEPELHSTDLDRPLAYPVRDGIPVLLADDARPLDAPARRRA